MSASPTTAAPVRALWLGAVRAMLQHEARRVLRDQFLLGMAAYVLGMAAACRWLVPWGQAELLAATGFDLTPYVPLGISYFILINASVVTGLIGGLLLLETREDRTIKALLVAPVPLWAHLTVQLGALWTAGFVLAAVEWWVVGVGVPPLLPGLVAAALCAPHGLVTALILATAAKNKVEAFALIKITSLLGLVPILAFFAPEPWQLLAGLVSPYWACKIWWTAAAGDPGWAVYIAPGVVVSVVWVGVLLRSFTREAYR